MRVGAALDDPGGFEIIGFGVILGRGMEAGQLAGVFGFASIVFGSLIGAGFVLSGDAPVST